jgi:FlaA1/EpsC-like NDP-sugar epimerase
MLYSLLLTLDRPSKAAVFFAIDLVLMAIAASVALALAPVELAPAAWIGLSGLMLAVLAAGLRISRLHRVMLNHYQSRAICITFLLGAVSAAAGAALSAALGLGLGVAPFAIAFMVFVLVSVFARMLLREIVVAIYRRRPGTRRVLIYGAGQTGQQFAAALQADHSIFPVGFLDDERSLQGAMISGLQVYPTRDLADRVAAMRVDRIVLAMPSISDVEKAAIAERLSPLSCEVHSMPSFGLCCTNRVLSALPLSPDGLILRAL